MNEQVGRRLAAECDAIRDEATVALLRATSPAAALMVADHDERAGVPAYDALPGLPGDWRPTDRLLVCPAPGCGRRFWAAVADRVYCSVRCRVRAYDRRCKAGATTGVREAA